MANIVITYGATDFKFKEAAINNGAIANGLTISLANGTFAGDNGDLVDAKITNVPVGLNAVLVKTSATTARLTFEGLAANHASNFTGLALSFTADAFATGTTNAEGSAATTLEKTFDIDFKAPVTTGLTLVPTMADGDVVAPDTTAIYTAGSTKTGAKDNLPTIGGVGTKGETLYFYSNGKILDKTISTKVGDTGEWTYDLSGLASKFKDGTHIVTVSTSADGKGVMSNPFAFTVDSKAPSAPSVTAVKGAISDTTPVLTGKAEKNATVKVYSSETQVDPIVEDGTVSNAKDVTLLGTTKADAKGVWTLAVTDPSKLATDGGYKISAKAIDAAGNATVSKAQAKDNLTIDTTIATPTLEASDPKKNTVALKGNVAGETGGGTLQLYGGEDGSVPLGKVIKIAKDGSWKSSVKLTEGKHLLSVVATDAAGNVSANSLVKEVTIDTSTAIPTLELGETKGNAWSTMYGTAEAGAEVTVKNGSTEVGKATADSAGKWVLDTSAITAPTKNGVAKLTASAKDGAGNVSKASAPVEFTVDTEYADTAAPTLVYAATSDDGSKVVLTYSQALATTGKAIPGDFAVKVGSSANTVTAVETSGAKVTLTLATAAKAGQAVTVKYTNNSEADTTPVDTDAAIQDKAGNDVASMTDAVPVTNLVPVTEEAGGDSTFTVTATSITPSDEDTSHTYTEGDTITLEFSQAIDATNIVIGDLVLSGAHSFGTGATLTPTTGKVTDFVITLGTNPTVAKNDTITIAAAKLVGGSDTASSADVTFTVGAVETTPPAAVGNGTLTQNDDSNTTADADDALVFTFSEAIGNKEAVAAFFTGNAIYGASATPASAAWNEINTVLTVTLGTGATYNAGTPITITGVQDLAGNSANLVFSFTEAAGGGGGDAFTVTENGIGAGNVELTFGGTAAGDITVTESGGILTFALGDVEATTKPAITDLAADTGIPAAPDSGKLVMTDEVYTAIADKLAPAAAVKLSNDTLTLAKLATIETGQTGFVDATAVTTTTGTVADALSLLVTKAGTTGNTIDMAAAVAVTLTDATTTLQAADLSAIGGATTGTVTVANEQTITGTSAQVIAALATAATKVEMATGKVATVDLADSAQTFTAEQLTSVYGALGGTVIGTEADTITVTTLNGTTVAATESIDTFQFASGDAGATITDFAIGAGKDVLQVTALGTLVGTGTTGDVAASNAIYNGATSADTKGDTAVSKVVVIADKAATDWTDVVTKIGDALTVAADTTAGNAATVVLINNGADTRVYLFSDDATSDTTVETSELTLVATLMGIATNVGLVEGNFGIA